MLLTHAGCAFKDPRGRFGISNSCLAADQCRSRGTGMKSEFSLTERGLHVHHASFCALQQLELPQFRTAALRSNRQCGAAAFRTWVPLRRIPSQRVGKKITCTARPDGSDARNGRLQPARCVRTAALHDRGRHESGGCNGSRLPAVPDTSRRRQPWRSE